MKKLDKKQILLDAADLIDKTGLIKGVYYDARGENFCLVGAVIAVIESESTDIDWWDAWDIAEDIGNLVHPDATNWNDKWYRTKGQVVRRMRRTARSLKDE
jgi:hypothetical protein